MHSALFVAKRHDHDVITWSKFSEETCLYQQATKGVQRLSANVWMINLYVAPTALSSLIISAEKLGVPYGVISLPAEPKWLIGDVAVSSLSYLKAG